MSLSSSFCAVAAERVERGQSFLRRAQKYYPKLREHEVKDTTADGMCFLHAIVLQVELEKQYSVWDIAVSFLHWMSARKPEWAAYVDDECMDERVENLRVHGVMRVRLNDGVHVFVPATSTRICICWIDALALSIGIGVIPVFIAMGYSCRSSRSGSGHQSSYYVATAKEKSISWRVLPRTWRILSFSRSRIIAISPNTSTRSVAEATCAKVKSESGIGSEGISWSRGRTMRGRCIISMFSSWR